MSALSHQVDIFKTGNLDPVCEGTIISSYLILTIASCFGGKSHTLFEIKAKGQTRMHHIEDVYSYPGVKSEPSPFDVAVVLLSSSLDMESISELPFGPNEDLGKLTYKATVCRERSTEPVERKSGSECAEEEEDKNFVCTSPASTQGSRARCSLPRAGSGLVCSQNGSDFLCGVLALDPAKEEETNGNWREEKRVYRRMAAYLPWVNLAFHQNEKVVQAESESNTSDHGLAATAYNAKDVDQVKNPVPYQLNLQRHGAFHCGAVILDKKTALCAAHCFAEKRPALQVYSVVAGEQNLDRNDTTEQVLGIKKLFKHHNYTGVFAGSDIAVIQLDGEFNFNDRVNNVWISSPTAPDFQDVTMTATGWGKTATHGASSNVLQSFELKLFDREVCKTMWSFLKPSISCGFSNFSNTCLGDSGGPLVIKNYNHEQTSHKDLLVGVTSFANQDCEKLHFPNGFTNVSHFYEFIARRRSDSSCSSSQFQCFNGECIDKELRCDKKYDCEDGSDEKVCKYHSRITKSCGGLIELAHSHTIEWRAPTSHPHPNSNCLWVIVNSHADRPTKTQINILNDEPRFDAAASQLYVVQDLTASQLSTSQLNGMGLGEYNFTQPILMLYFRTTSTKNDRGIHLKIMDHSNYTATNAQGLAVAEELNQKTSQSQSQSQSLSHVYSGSHCKSKTTSRHIFRGAPQVFNSNSQNPPYVVSIKLDGEHLCSGVILDKRTALSTAGCFDWQEEEGKPVDLKSSMTNRTRGIQVVAGERNLKSKESTEQILEIQSLVQHEKWIHPRVSDGNDIAIIHVKGEFTFNEHVNNIWISSPEMLNLEGGSGSVSAWITFNRSEADFLPDLKTMEMDILKNSECKKKYKFLKESMICGSKNSESVCGMNGAPLVLKDQSLGNSTRDVLIGLSAFGPSSCESLKKPIGFTRVDYFYDWIEKNRANSICSSSQFQCYNGQCIDKKLKCNYVFECSDGSDESVCTSGSESATTIKQLDSCARRRGNGNAIVDQSNARDQENVFAFLKPVEVGGRIQVHLDSLQMETAQDSLKIISFSQNTQEITQLDSLGGAGSWFNRTFSGDENEPVLVYFHARPGNENQKMDLSYKENPKV